MLAIRSTKCPVAFVGVAGALVVLVTAVHVFMVPILPASLDYFGARSSISRPNNVLPAVGVVDSRLRGRFPSDSYGAVAFRGAPWKAEIGRWLAGCHANSSSVDVTEAIGAKRCEKDCSGRGVCNYNLGECRCFHGYSGKGCEEVLKLECNLPSSPEWPVGLWIVSTCAAHCDKTRAMCFCGPGTKYPDRPVAEACGFKTILPAKPDDPKLTDWKTPDLENIFTTNSSELGWCNVVPEDAYSSKVKFKEECDCKYDGLWARILTLQLQMPGVRSESSLPEVRRIRMALPTASSKVASARAKLAEGAKTPANSKAKGRRLDDQEKRCKNGRLVPSLGCRTSPPLMPVGPDAEKKKCSWITANSEPLYVTFHDEEWGVPVHDDRMLFELLTLSLALGELTWPSILSKREEFREIFDGFNFALVSEFTEKKINLLRSNGIVLLSEQKIRAVVTNAKQMQKVVKDFGSFSNYCWSFVNHRPITNGFRYSRQVPTKTPKAEAISRDLMRRGFQCVGPTTIYSFMQVAGIVNDHLSCCFRFQACSQHKGSENNVRAEPALPDTRLGSLSSEDSDTREV